MKNTNSIIKVKSEHLTTIKHHSSTCYPHECCGLLVGTKKGKEKRLVKVVKTENDWHNQKHLFHDFATKPDRNSRDSFCIAPETLIKTQKQARQENLDIIGVYHSHPNHPAVPSRFDEQIAWSGYSYIILSVMGQKIGDLLSWSLNLEGKFCPEIVQLIK